VAKLRKGMGELGIARGRNRFGLPKKWYPVF
jgi:hypothetical protein